MGRCRPWPGSPRRSRCARSVLDTHTAATAVGAHVDCFLEEIHASQSVALATTRDDIRWHHIRRARHHHAMSIGASWYGRHHRPDVHHPVGFLLLFPTRVEIWALGHIESTAGPVQRTTSSHQRPRHRIVRRCPHRGRWLRHPGWDRWRRRWRHGRGWRHAVWSGHGHRRSRGNAHGSV